MEKKRRNSPHRYRVAKQLLRIVTAGALLLCQTFMLSAQDRYATAVYDAQKGELTITAYNTCKFVYTEGMPTALRSSLGPDKILEVGHDREAQEYVVKGIRSEEMEGFSSFTVFTPAENPVENTDDPFVVPETVKISVLNKPASTTPATEVETVTETTTEEPTPKTETENAQAPKQPFYAKWLALGKSVVYFASGGLLLLIALLVTLLLLRRKRKVKVDSGEDSPHVMQVIEEEENDYAVGLDYVRQHAEDYFAMDMEEFCLDTAVKKIFFSREAVKSLNSYFKTFLEQPERTNETGCYLIGGWEKVNGSDEQYNISVEEMVIPGDDAVYDEYSLNFGLKIGIKLGSAIRNLCEKTGRDYVHTVWMHSHPGLGLFLSSHDLAVQKQLAYPDAPKRMVAIVIDTNTPNWQMAFFTAKNSGGMNNKDDLRKTISFDVLNEWSRHKTVVAQSSEMVENCFVVSTEDTRDKFAFSAKTINQIDDAIYADAPEKSHPLYGEIRKNGETKTRVVTACDTRNEDKIIGLLILDSNTDEAFDAHRFDEKLSQTDFCLVFRSEQECYVVWQTTDRKIQFVHTSIKEMKEWTRRKRI